MKVSIIIPVHNGSDTIRRCVEGYLSQSDRDTEVILVENGSSDGSWLVCRQLAREDERVRLFQRDSAGVSAARNMGLQEASGEILGFADADDVPETGILDRVRREFQQDPKLGVLVTGFTRGYPDGRMTEKRIRWRKNMSFRRLAELSLHDGRISGYSWNKFWRREYLEGIRFREELSHGEDIHFAVKALMAHPKEKGLILPVSGYRYYQHEKSATGCRDSLFDEENRLKLIRGAEAIRQEGRYGWWIHRLVERLIFSMASSQYLRFGLNGEQKRLLMDEMNRYLGSYLLTSWTEPVESAGRILRLIQAQIRERKHSAADNHERQQENSI